MGGLRRARRPVAGASRACGEEGEEAPPRPLQESDRGVEYLLACGIREHQAWQGSLHGA